MIPQNIIDFERIEKSIKLLTANFRSQPSLEEVAKAIQLSPFHFQRMFRRWAGVSPKQFTQYLSVEYAKNLLAHKHSVLETALNTGLSGPSRLHDMFIQIEGVTPGEFKDGGSRLVIHYNLEPTPFGKVFLASTPRGICAMNFENSLSEGLKNLRIQFPKAKLYQMSDELQKKALSFFNQDWEHPDKVNLHIKGTPFQIKVWESLLKIPQGNLVSYGELAQRMGKPDASRAVGTAIGKNPVAFLIPCHRVIQSTGQLGGYRWGLNKKTTLIGWEAAQLSRSPNEQNDQVDENHCPQQD